MSRQEITSTYVDGIDRLVSKALFLIVSGCSLILFGGHSHSIDEETYLAGLRSFLHLQPQIDIQSTPLDILVTTPGKSGIATSIYGFGTTLFYLPMYFLGKVVSLLVDSAWQEQVLRLFLFSTNSFALGITCTGIYLCARFYGAYRKVAIGGTFAYGLGSFAFANAGTGFSEQITAMFLIVGFYFFIRHRTGNNLGIALSGFFIGCSVLMRPSALIFVPLLIVNLVFSVNRKHLITKSSAFIAGISPPLITMFIYNAWKWGSPLDSGYPDLSYNTPWYEGLYGLFFSSGKGLVWFAPIMIVSLVFGFRAIQKFKIDSLTLWLCVLINAILFCRFEVWSGDDAYGPRYMGIVLPLLVLLAIIGSSHINRVAVWIAFLFGLPSALAGSLIYVNASNASRLQKILDTVGSSSVQQDGSYNWTLTRRSVNFTPRLSQLVEHIASIPQAFQQTLKSFHRESVPFAGGVKSGLSWYISPNRIDIWWLYWIESGAPLIFLSLILIPIFMLVRGLIILKKIAAGFAPAEQMQKE